MARVCVIYGDGISPEVVTAAIKVADATGVGIEWEEVPAGITAMEKYGTPVPDQTIDAVRKAGVLLKGPMTNVRTPDYPRPNVLLTRKLGLYGQIRTGKHFEGTSCRFPGTDLAVVRETSEGEYQGEEMRVGPRAVVSLKPTTWEGSTRIARLACDWAVRTGKKKITVAGKPNNLRLSDVMFMEAAQTVAREYEGIEIEEMNHDALAMYVVQKPEMFSVLLLQNLAGDIFSDLVAGLTGGLGLSPGVMFGPGVAMFSVTHGTAPKYAGMDKVNPCAMILSVGLMLRHLGFGEAAGRVDAAVAKTIREGKWVTYDLGGSASTSEVAAAIADIVAMT